MSRTLGARAAPSMRLPRMTTRRWMVTVGIVALGLGACMLVARSRGYAVQAANHGYQEFRNRMIVDAYERDPLTVSTHGPTERIIDRLRRFIPYDPSGPVPPSQRAP